MEYHRRGKLAMTAFPKRGEVYWVKLDPAIGTETRKTRPALVVSNDIGNEVSSRVIVTPITSKTDKVYSFETELDLHNTKNKVMLDQIRSIDKRRLGERIATLPESKMKEVD